MFFKLYSYKEVCEFFFWMNFYERLCKNRGVDILKIMKEDNFIYDMLLIAAHKGR